MSLPGRYDIPLVQGATLSIPITLKKADGSLYDLSNCTARAQIRKFHRSTAKVAEFTATIPEPKTQGVVILSLTAIQTAAIPAGETSTDERSKYVYDVEIENTVDGTVERVLNGNVYVSAEVTR